MVQRKRWLGLSVVLLLCVVRPGWATSSEGEGASELPARSEGEGASELPARSEGEGALHLEQLAMDIYDAENLVFDRKGRLFITGGDGLHLLTIDPASGEVSLQKQIIDLEASYVGLDIGPDGFLYVACLVGTKARIIRVDIDGPTFTYATFLEGTISAPNGLIIDRDGTLYVADFGWYLPRKGRLWRIEKNPEDPARAGQVTPIVTGKYCLNGLAIDANRGRLYVTSTLGGRIYYVEREASGLFGGPTQLLIDIDRPGPGFPIIDDMTVDPQGRIYACHYNRDEILVLSPEGKIERRLPFDELAHPTSAVFGRLEGDRSTLYVTQKGHIFRHDKNWGDCIGRIKGVW